MSTLNSTDLKSISDISLFIKQQDSQIVFHLCLIKYSVLSLQKKLLEMKANGKCVNKCKADSNHNYLLVL